MSSRTSYHVIAMRYRGREIGVETRLPTTPNQSGGSVCISDLSKARAIAQEMERAGYTHVEIRKL